MKISYLFLYIFIILIIGFAQAATILVYPGQDIQEAVDEVNPGDTIEVQSGIYQENVNIFKPVVLRGAGNPIINAADFGSGITLYSDDAVVDGIIIANSSASNPGINITSSSQGNAIQNNTITRNRGDGIGIWASGNNRISGNIISNNGGNGLSLWAVEKNYIDKNFITSNNGSGIFGGASNSSIRGNFIYKNNGSGIVLLNSFDNAISMSQANDNKDAGIMLIFGSDNVISDSTFNNNINSGISLLFSWKNELVYNAVNRNLEGIYLGNSSEGNLVNGNDVRYNLLGIHLDSSNNNTICQNNLFKNDHSAFDDGINQWDLNENGNYYSDFDCSDSNEDGICDKSRSIPGGISSDRYPLASSLKQQIVDHRRNI